MVLKRQDALNTILDGISWLAMSCQRRGELHLFDANTISHEFFRRFLNEVYGLQLFVMDRIQDNYPAIDLGDESRRHAFQITSDGLSDKIQATLDMFIKHNLHKKYDRIQVIVIGRKQATYGVLVVPPEITFSTDDDIIDLRSLSKHIETLETPHLERLAEIVESEIKAFKEGQPKLKRVIRVAFLASSPRDTPQLEMAREINSLMTLVGETDLRRYLDLVTWWVDTLSQLLILPCVFPRNICHLKHICVTCLVQMDKTKSVTVHRTNLAQLRKGVFVSISAWMSRPVLDAGLC